MLEGAAGRLLVIGAGWMVTTRAAMLEGPEQLIVSNRSCRAEEVRAAVNNRSCNAGAVRVDGNNRSSNVEGAVQLF